MTNHKKQDPQAGVITERMNALTDSIEDAFPLLHAYDRRDLETALQKLEDAVHKRNVEATRLRLKELRNMLSAVGVSCESLKELRDYQQAVADCDIPNDTDKRLLRMLCDIYRQYPTPGKFLERTVRALDPAAAASLSPDPNADNSNALRLLILRQFLKTVNVPENSYYSSSLAKLAKRDPNAIDESVFAPLDGEKPIERKKAPLLYCCHDLAKGIFISPTSTKTMLMLFAFAYEMRYYPSRTETDYVTARDVEKNLFVDYYCDNIARYLYADESGKQGMSDAEPSGLGLNPKNFVDITFAYYLNRGDLHVKERTSRFFAMIDCVSKAYAEQHERFDAAAKQSFESAETSRYRETLHSSLLHASEDALRQHLLAHYYCDRRISYFNEKSQKETLNIKGLFELQFSVNTPYRMYLEQLEDIKSYLAIDDEVDLSVLDDRRARLNARGELMSKDPQAKAAEQLKQLEYFVPRLDMPKPARPAKKADDAQNLPKEKNINEINAEYLRELLGELEDSEGIRLVMKNVAKRLEPKYALGVPSAEKLTRTRLIAAMYHSVCLRYTQEEDPEYRSLRAFYEEAISLFDPSLEAAGYQPISPKNLYDMFVIFYAYCMINNRLSKHVEQEGEE